jgi:hypothetical protein
LFIAGLHEPVIPFKDVVGNAGNVAPAQMAAIGLKAGVIGDAMFTSNVVIAVAHCPAAGVKV